MCPYSTFYLRHCHPDAVSLNYWHFNPTPPEHDFSDNNGGKNGECDKHDKLSEVDYNVFDILGTGGADYLYHSKFQFGGSLHLWWMGIVGPFELYRDPQANDCDNDNSSCQRATNCVSQLVSIHFYDDKPSDSRLCYSCFWHRAECASDFVV